MSGEIIIDGLIREIYEELGIKLLREEAIFLKTVKKDYECKEIYLFKKDIQKEEIKFTDREAIDASKWYQDLKGIHKPGILYFTPISFCTKLL